MLESKTLQSEDIFAFFHRASPYPRNYCLFIYQTSILHQVINVCLCLIRYIEMRAMMD